MWKQSVYCGGSVFKSWESSPGKWSSNMIPQDDYNKREMAGTEFAKVSFVIEKSPLASLLKGIEFIKGVKYQSFEVVVMSQNKFTTF